MPLPAPMRALLALTLCLTLLPASGQTRPRIEKAADLPRFSYRVDGSVEDLVRQADRFTPFAAAVRRDVDSVLSGYDIADKATRRDLLTTLALLDLLDGRPEQALARAEEVRSLQDKPADKLISGLRLRAVATAARSHALGSEAHRQAVAEFIARELAAMPFATVQNEVRELKAGAELVGEGLVLGRLREVLQPIVASSGALSSDFAWGLVGTRYTLLTTLPLKQTYINSFSRYLAANQVAKRDIWAERDQSLDGRSGLAPVTVAVWDSGVDTALFGDRVRRDAAGRPLVIGFDKYSRPAPTELQPIPPELKARLPQLKARTKGLSDLEANIDSPEASEVKAYLSGLSPDQYKAASEELGLVGNYTHGTHVAGIAMAGNPAARLLVARIEFGHTLKPDPCPSREGALRDAAAAGATVAFFKRHGVRVANMSWGGSINDVESELEKCGIGKTPDERKRIARELYTITKRALTTALRGAPGILFVAAAGNSGDNATFTESYPADIVLPNLLTVGAVDLAGDEASFTSDGPTVKVHANGYLVDSVIPGGERVAFSGTSMASPQVANLAAKLLAVNPRLKPAQLAQLIIGTAQRSADGRRHLIHPRQALARAEARR
ncbi:MAG: Subtilisin [Pseudomonadota bacterium]|jgi:subtilisin family serine protease